MINKTLNNLRKRNKSEARFIMLGRVSIFFSMSFLILLFVMILSKSSTAFFRTKIALEIDLTNYSESFQINYDQIIKSSLKKRFPEIQELKDFNLLYQLISRISILELKNQIQKNPQFIGKKTFFWLSLSSKADMYIKKNIFSGLNEKQLRWISDFEDDKQLKKFFNWEFFTFGDSREPEIAGIGAGLVGSFMVMIIFLIVAFPIAVMCAFYLEEFAPKNIITDIIEISINNLAAIPSIIYGLLGLTIYLQIMQVPRSSSLVGGMTLFMLVLPVIIIATRNTIRTIPNSIRDGASALGASKLQIVLHHLLPLSIPGIMTGTILAISRALGETAPLLMIGMVAFIVDIPKSIIEPTSVLPVQIFLWSDSQEIGFAEKTAAAILILLIFLVLLNSFAIFLRKKYERKW
jgi:phosphate transport system permease protein